MREPQRGALNHDEERDKPATESTNVSELIAPGKHPSRGFVSRDLDQLHEAVDAVVGEGHTLSSPRLRTQMRPSSGSISIATPKTKLTSSPRSLATRSMVLTRETLFTCMGQAASAAMA
jgi:hypothetical protein